MSKKTVAVIFGGRSSEHEISRLSAANIISAMSLDKYLVVPVYITKEGKWLLYDGALDNIKNIQWEKYGTSVILSTNTAHKGLLRIVGDKIKAIPIDIAFLALHGQNGEDGTIQGLCEIAGIPYVGCGVLSSSLCMDKGFSNLIAHSIGVRQAEYMVVLKNELEDMDGLTKKIRYKLGYPCFVKPANNGSSVGISKVANKKELVAALLLASELDRRIVVEKAVVGREVECAVLGNANPQAAAVGEIIPNASFYDFDAKYNSTESHTVVPAELSEEKTEEIRELAVKIYRAMDCCGMARVDFFIEEGTETILFNEINTIPGFTAISLYPALWNAVGMETSELVDHLIELAFERFA